MMWQLVTLCLIANIGGLAAGMTDGWWLRLWSFATGFSLVVFAKWSGLADAVLAS